MRVDTPITAPPLDAAVAWLNVERPLRLRELRGSVVLLDFWTYCCINCMHVQPVLRQLGERYADAPVVIIGVHSGKFYAERDPDRVREAIGRYGVEHPVAVDESMAIWSAYGIRSWPTLVVVRPDGKIAAIAPGEPKLEVLDAVIAEELARAQKAGTLAARKPRIRGGARVSHEPLLYPGKVALAPDGRLLIADSGHHRVLLTAPDGRVLLTAGSGLRGLMDGPVEEAAFDDPQGLCMVDGAIYVADARNHALRKIDVEMGTVSTVAGTGELGEVAPEGRVPGTETALRSPWDLCPVGDVIYVAMAGGHQIWRYFLKTGEIERYAGTGVEALLDGAAGSSAWAQPSGLAARAGVLYVADSESSAVRSIDLERDLVATLVGQGLFAFGDDDGAAEEAMLQHCLGVAIDGDDLLIADTYNGKIKRWSIGDGDAVVVTELDGLSEPGAVAVREDGVLFIADTNAHRILGVREGAIAELAIRGAPAPREGSLEATRGDRPPSSLSRGWFTNMLTLPEGTGLKAGDAGISLILRTPPGTALAPRSPLSVRAEVSRRSDLIELTRPSFSLQVRGGRKQLVLVEARVGALVEEVIEAEVVVTIDYVACRQEDIAMCFPDRVHVRVPVRLLRDGGERQLEFGVNLASVDATDGAD